MCKNLKKDPDHLFKHKAINFFFLILLIQFIMNVFKLYLLYHIFQTNTKEDQYNELIANNCLFHEPSKRNSLYKIYSGIDYFIFNYNTNLISVVVENGIAISLFFITFLPYISVKEMLWL